jgi:hypothetical protein
MIVNEKEVKRLCLLAFENGVLAFENGVLAFENGVLVLI